MTPQPLAPSASPLDRAAALLGSDPRAAEQLAAGLLRQAPGDPRVRLILGSAKRRLGDLAALVPRRIDKTSIGADCLENLVRVDL